jgi:hypothetical protein
MANSVSKNKDKENNTRNEDNIKEITNFLNKNSYASKFGENEPIIYNISEFKKHEE